MMPKKKRCLCYLYFFFIIFITRSAASSSNYLLGISPQDEKYYSEPIIKCRDGSNKKFNKSQLNDNFCDCPDGTDEPGTSACPHGKFYCMNAGHVPRSIFSSRVNDGICDCCDGSDEYNGQIKCPNTCWEAGKVARDKLKKKIATYQEGVTIRRREVEQAKLAIAKDEAELSKLKSEEKILKGLVQQLQDRKEQIDKAEERERIQKEKEEKEKEEREKKDSEEAQASNGEVGGTGNPEGQPTENTDDGKIGLLEDSPPLQDVMVHGHPVDDVQHTDNHVNEGSPSERKEHAAKEGDELAVEYEADLDTESKGEDASENTNLSKEELGRIVGSRWTGKKSEQEETVEIDSAGDLENHGEQVKNAHDEGYNSYESDNEDEQPTYDDDDTEDQVEDFVDEDHDASSSSYSHEFDDDTDFSDISSTSGSSWLEKIQKTVRNILQAVNLFQTPVDKSEAAHVRKEYEELSSKLSKMQSRISSLTQKLKHDFGRDKEFYSLYGQCLEIKQNKYVYKVCPFKQATQEEGHSTSRLGSWDKFDDSYRIMRFSNGDKCWNGPDRSLTVRLRCGLKNEVTDVGEPSRCEYEAFLSTPSLCVEERLKELQDKLDLMNKEQPHGRDEL